MQSTDQQQRLFGYLDVAARTLLSPSEGGRVQNEDNYLVVDVTGKARYLQDQQEVTQQIEDWPAGFVRLAILDGMGGHSFGREAAERAVRGLLEVEATANIGSLSDQLDVFSRVVRNLHLVDDKSSTWGWGKEVVFQRQIFSAPGCLRVPASSKE